MSVRRVLLSGFCGLWVATGAFAGSNPVAVSPGDPAKLVLISDACPTFSWDPVEGASEHELVIYQVDEEGQAAESLLRQQIPGSASSWTPPLGSCLERGGQYAWSVRAMGRKEASEWSAPNLFEVAAGPSEVEFEEALQVVQQYLTVQGPSETAGAAPAVSGSTAVAATSGATAEVGAPVPGRPGRTARAPQAPETVSLVTEGAIGLGTAEPQADLHVVGGSPLLGDMLLAPNAQTPGIPGDAELLLAGYSDGREGMKIKYDGSTRNLEVWGYHGVVGDKGPWLTINADMGETTFRGQIFRYKQDIEDLTSSTVLQSDDHLSLDLGSHELWTFEALLWISTTATADFKFLWRGPTGSDVRSNVLAYQGSQIIEQSSLLATNSVKEIEYPTDATLEPIYMKGLFWSGTGGTITLEWAQIVASGLTRVFFPSYLEARRVKMGSFYP